MMQNLSANAIRKPIPPLILFVLLTFAGLLGFALLFLYRLPREERMMLDVYGDEYRDYMSRVGGLVPRLRRDVHRSLHH